MKEALQDIWMVETRDDAYHAFSTFQKRFEAKYPKATDCLVKDKAEMLAFYDCPAEHWVHIRTTNPIESMFATVRLRTNKTKNCGNRKITLMMVLQVNAQCRDKVASSTRFCTTSGCCERCSLQRWSERNGGSSTSYSMILYTPHLTIALFSLCHTLSYSCFANVRFCENDLCPKVSQFEFLPVALR